MESNPVCNWSKRDLLLDNTDGMLVTCLGADTLLDLVCCRTCELERTFSPHQPCASYSHKGIRNATLADCYFNHYHPFLLTDQDTEAQGINHLPSIIWLPTIRPQICHQPYGLGHTLPTSLLPCGFLLIVRILVGLPRKTSVCSVEEGEEVTGYVDYLIFQVGPRFNMELQFGFPSLSATTAKVQRK